VSSRLNAVLFAHNDKDRTGPNLAQARTWVAAITM
jgi:hypothetical protein